MDVRLSLARLSILGLTVLMIAPLLGVQRAYGVVVPLPAVTVWSPFGPWEQSLIYTAFGVPAATLAAFGAGSIDIPDVVDPADCGGPPVADWVCTSAPPSYIALAGWDFSGATPLLAPPGVGASLVSVAPGSQVPCPAATGGFAAGCGFWPLLNMRQKPNSQTVCPGLVGCTTAAAFFPGAGNDELIRRSITGGTAHLSPIFAGTAIEQEIVSQIYDSMLKVNPLTSGGGTQLVDWMVNSVSSSISGGITTLSFQLRATLFWSDGPQVTSNDVCYSLAAYMNIPGSTYAPLIPAGTTCITPSPTTVVIAAPTTPGFLQNIGSLPIIPKHIWSLVPVCGLIPNPLSPCAAPAFDPVAMGIMIGSGPWVCNPTVGVSTIGGQPNCTISAGAGQVLGAGDKLVLRRYDPDIAAGLSYMRCCPNEQKSSLHLSQWADVQQNGRTDILDVAQCALFWVMHSGLCDSPLYGLGTNEIVDIVEMSNLALHYSEGLTLPFVPPTTAVAVDPLYDPYQWSTAGDPLVTYIGLYRPAGAPLGAEIELAARGGAAIPPANVPLFTAELFSCPATTVPFDCPSGAVVFGPVGGVAEGLAPDEIVFTFVGPIPAGTYGVVILFGGVPLNPFVQSIEGSL